MIRAIVVVIASLLLASVATGCSHVRPYQRERLASPAMKFEMTPGAKGQEDTILEITEGNTFASAGPGNAGAGCGCH